MTVPARRHESMPAAGTVEDVLIRGNLADLTAEQRTEYYMRVCQSIGLNPLTRPFEYITLQGKLTLYAKRDCADQLRKINHISVEIVSQDRAGDLLSVHVRAKDKDGRTDEDLGVVSMPQTLKGDAAANTILKAVTKAKRRVTLSISGLGFLDETEVADIPGPAKAEPQPAPNQIKSAPIEPPSDPQTGEVLPHEIDWPGDNSPVTWGGKYIAAIKTAADLTDLAEWEQANDGILKMVKEKYPKAYRSVDAAKQIILKGLTEILVGAAQ